jgi:arylsulfatase A-like enzyme
LNKRSNGTLAMKVLQMLGGLAIALAIGARLAIADGPAGAKDRPNIVILFTDDQRADTIAALGNSAIHTPNLDRLARRGFAFHSAYCMGSTMPAVCNPSRHMMLSGMSLYRYDPKKAEGTLGDVMRNAGYVTYHLSKRGNEAREYHKAFEHSSYLEDQKDRTSGHHGRSAANRAIEFLRSRWDRDRPLLM